MMSTGDITQLKGRIIDPERILILGGDTALGRELSLYLTSVGYSVTAFTRQDLDIFDEVSIHSYFFDAPRYNVAINCETYAYVKDSDPDSAANSFRSMLPYLLGANIQKYYHITTDPIEAKVTDSAVYSECCSLGWAGLLELSNVRLEKKILEAIEIYNFRGNIIRVPLATYGAEGTSGFDIIKSLKSYAEGKDTITVPTNILVRPSNAKIIAMEIGDIIKHSMYIEYEIGYNKNPALYLQNRQDMTMFTAGARDLCSLHDFAVAVFDGTKTVVPVEVVLNTDCASEVEEYYQTVFSPQPYYVGIFNTNTVKWIHHLESYEAGTLILPEFYNLLANVPIGQEDFDVRMAAIHTLLLVKNCVYAFSNKDNLSYTLFYNQQWLNELSQSDQIAQFGTVEKYEQFKAIVEYLS